MASIELFHRGGSRQGETDRIELRDGDVATIGRVPDATVAFNPQTDRVVSRRHAQLTRVRGDAPCWQLADLQSMHGVFVNGHRLAADVMLAVGDEVQLGRDGPVLVVEAMS